MLAADPALVGAELALKEQLTMAPMELSSDKATAPAKHRWTFAAQSHQ